MDEKFVKYKSLIELTKTTQDLVDLEEEINALSNSLYNTEINKFDQILEESVRVSMASEIKKLLKSCKISGKDEIKNFLTDAYQTISSLPILILTLAFEPSEQVIYNISSWVRTNFEERIILDLVLDRRLLGGTLIEYKGKYYDYSVRKKLEENFENKEDIII